MPSSSDLERRVPREFPPAVNSYTRGLPNSTSAWTYNPKLGQSIHGRPPENIGISGFDYKHAATFYRQVFERRFGDDPEEGYAHLEAIMESKEPSFGYSVLAQILTKTRHRVVITWKPHGLFGEAQAG